MVKPIVLIHKKGFLIFFALFLTGLSTYAQEGQEGGSRTDRQKIVAKNEMTISTGPFYVIGEKAVLYGLIMQYIRRIGNSKLGIGLGYEKLWDMNKHSSVGIVGVYHPVKFLTISALVGPTYLSHPGSYSTFGVHSEMSYRTKWKYFLIGPFYEIGYIDKSAHISIGMKAGLAF